tara:strand:+ start:412 stop:621 length:210 start_codon:yes stop_codon:yes gene_type:complete
MSDEPKATTEKKVDNDAINFKNAAITKINSLQAALKKEKKKKRKVKTVRTMPRIQGMGQLGAHSKASKK